MRDDALSTEDFFRRNCAASAKSKYPEHFTEAAEAEATATEIREYAPLLIPGLLQTPAYTRAVCRAYQPTAPNEVIEELVAARMDRARLLDDPTKPELWAVLDEAALRRVTGGREVMADALGHIISLIRRNRIIVQVLPFEAGAHASLEGAIKLMEIGRRRKSTYSGGSGDNCLEVGVGNPVAIPVRDSKDPHGPRLRFQADAWSVFVDGIKAAPASR
ncbi:DUF397 domain-containing protein [Streptomyces sp. NPDC000351]|uniref:DUF397 domain-containing protein n=1 Tax=Streptomyces sp. NPDC000351 TaxID=3154250 RepID=UPI00331E7F2C